jgi:hypothetical protein
MSDNLADHGVGNISALVGIGDRRDPVQELEGLLVIGYQSRQPPDSNF